MFNRTRSPGGQQSAIASAFDEVLAELASRETPEPANDPSNDQADAPAPSAGDTVIASTTDRLLDHADALRATRDAQYRAQEMLALAATARTDATDQAEQIVLEAKAAADQVRSEAENEAERTRREAVAWVKEQRTRVETAAATLARNAERDAENIRTEAMRSAMAEAEQTARLYVAEAAARGARDAEEMRGNAREVLHRASELGTDLQASMAGLVRALESAAGAVSDQLRAIDALLGEHAGAPAASETAAMTEVADEIEEVDEAAAFDATGPSTDAASAEVDLADEIDGQREQSKQLGSLFRDQAS